MVSTLNDVLIHNRVTEEEAPVAAAAVPKVEEPLAIETATTTTTEEKVALPSFTLYANENEIASDDVPCENDPKWHPLVLTKSQGHPLPPHMSSAKLTRSARDPM